MLDRNVFAINGHQLLQ